MKDPEKFEKAMLEFKRHFAPAASVAESDDYFTTVQLYDKFKNLTLSNAVKKKDFYDLLQKHGFIFEYFLDEFVWPVHINNDRK